MKGTWTELVASTAEPLQLLSMYIGATFLSGSATSMLLDIGIGPLTGEVIIIPDLSVGYQDSADSNTGCLYLPVPVDIPAGSRLIARIQSALLSDTVRIAVDQMGGAPWGGTRTAGPVTAYGVDAAASKGQVINANATANLKGAWTDLTTSSARPVRNLILLTGPNARVVTASESWMFDVGLWNGTAYDVVVPDHMVRYLSTETWRNQSPVLSPFGFDFPAGSRLGVRGSCSTASLTADAIVYGIG